MEIIIQMETDYLPTQITHVSFPRRHCLPHIQHVKWLIGLLTVNRLICYKAPAASLNESVTRSFSVDTKPCK